MVNQAHPRKPSGAVLVSSLAPASASVITGALLFFGKAAFAAALNAGTQENAPLNAGFSGAVNQRAFFGSIGPTVFSDFALEEP
jgi:hypothetical protein